MNARVPAKLRRKKSGWIGLLCGLIVVLTGCRLNPEAASRIAATRLALLPTETPAPPPPFLALCLVKTTVRQSMRAAPIASADVVGTLVNRAVLSVTLRSEDAAWVYGMNAAQVTGWVSAASVACTVPVEELVVPTPTPGPTPLTTPTATQASSTTTSTSTIASPTPFVLSPTATPAATATPVATATPAATDTPLPPTATATPATAPELICSVVITRGLNVRRGPGTNFAAFYRLDQGETFAAVGRSEDGRWLGGRIVATNQAGWIIGSSVSCDGSIETLATLTNNVLPTSEAATPTPTPAATATEAPTQTPTQAPSAEVTLTPTQAAVSTALATPTATVEVEAPTVAPTPTSAPTVSAAQDELACTVASPTGVYVRSGPSRAFEAFGVAKLGERFAATRRSANNEWLFGMSQEGLVGWVVAGGMNCATPLRNVPVIDPAIAQTPLPPPN